MCDVRALSLAALALSTVTATGTLGYIAEQVHRSELRLGWLPPAPFMSGSVDIRPTSVAPSAKLSVELAAEPEQLARKVVRKQELEGK